jgi:hypothetical protein
MFRKTLFLFCVVMLILASRAVPVFAKESPPTMEIVFTPTSATAMTFAVHEFKSSLYISVNDEVNGGQIWRSKDGNSWEPVTDLGFGINLNYKSSWSSTAFKGKLYVATNCSSLASPECPGIILRSANGKDWEQISLATGYSVLDKLGVFGNMIYATSVGSPTGSGGQIWRSRTGNPGTWEVVKDLDAGIWSSSAPTVYKNQVYISGYMGGASVFIWHSADGRHWDTTTLQITESVPGPDDFLTDDMLIVYKDALYFCVSNSIDGGTIYRTQDGENWAKVLSGLPMINGVNDMIVYEGDLYATVFYLVPDWSDYGTQLWRSHSGNPGSWEQVNLDPADWGSGVVSSRETMAILKGNLYIGNTTGSLYRMNTH